MTARDPRPGRCAALSTVSAHALAETGSRSSLRLVDVTRVLRDARRRRGLSIRAAALRCDVATSTWSDWENRRASPTAARLDEVLRRLSLDLKLVARPSAEPPGELQVARHLRRSLTQRARLAVGEQLDAVLAAAMEQPRLLTGSAAVGMWVPHVVARGPLPLPPVPPEPGLVVLRLDIGPPDEGRAQVAVEPPDALLAAGSAEQWPQLVTAARLLDGQVRDAIGRRLPPHRDPDEEREARDLLHTLTWGARGALPISATDSRAWRLGAPATLDEALVRQGLPPRNASRRPGQPR